MVVIQHSDIDFRLLILHFIMSGVSHSTIDNLVNRKTYNPKIKTLHKIALAFGFTLAELVDFPELNDFSFEDEGDS